MNLVDRLVERVFGKEIKRRTGLAVRGELAIRALDDRTDRPIRQDSSPRDRYAYDRQEILRDAWRPGG